MFEQFVEHAPRLGVLGVEISRGGETVLSQAWDGIFRRNIYSATKSVVATAVGIAVHEGLLSLSEKLTDVFAEEMPQPLPPYWEGSTVRDMLTMGLGYETTCLMAAQRWNLPEDNWVKAALAHPLVRPTGEKLFYTNAGPHLAAVLVQRRAGCDLDAYLKPRLFDPLGIRCPNWEKDPMGYNFGGAGLTLALPEMHRLGFLWLNGGRWEGKQLVEEDWLKECARKQMDTESGFGYGYLFWRGPRDSWRADGAYGQKIIMLPRDEMVIAIQAECNGKGELARLIQESILDQL